MRWPWSSRSDDTVDLARAGRPPWEAIAFPAVLGAFAALAVAGVWQPSSTLAYLVPFTAAFVATAAVLVATRERSFVLFGVDDHRVLASSGAGVRQRMRLDELAIVERELSGESPALTLTDLRGGTMHVPLGTWRNESSLMTALRDAIPRSGAKGHIGPDVPVAKPWWIDMMRIALGMVTLVPIVVLVRAAPAGEAQVQPVTPELIRETRGDQYSPFVPRTECDIYLVPLDAPSGENVTELERRMQAAIPEKTCATPSIVMNEGVIDEGRSQVDSQVVLATLRDHVYGAWGNRPITTLGVTTLDTFSPAQPDWRFVFGSRMSIERTQGLGVISTARMGSGDAEARRLATMAMRYVGFQYYGLPTNGDPTSALYPTIDSRDDLDRMRPQFSDPPPSAEDLDAARNRFLDGG